MYEIDYWSIAPCRAVENGGMVRSCHSNIRSNVVTNSSKLAVHNNILLTQHFGRLTKVLVVGVCHSTILQCDPYQMTKYPPIWPSSSSLPLLSCPLKHSRGQSPVRKKSCWGQNFEIPYLAIQINLGHGMQLPINHLVQRNSVVHPSVSSSCL